MILVDQFQLIADIAILEKSAYYINQNNTISDPKSRCWNF